MGRKVNQEMMSKMAKLMNTAVETPEGRRALAAAIAPPIKQEIERREITSLLLTRHDLPAGETPKYQKRPDVQAYWLDDDGEAIASPFGKEEVEGSISRIAAMPECDISVLKHGNVGSITDIQTDSANEIRKTIDGRTLTVLSAAVPDDNIVTVAGGDLTADALNEAISVIEDQELRVKYIVMRGVRVNDMRGWDLDPQIKREMVQKGSFKVYNGADIINSASMSIDEVLLIPEEEVGKYPVREELNVEDVSEKKRFKAAWLAWMEVGHVITRSELLAKVVITN